MIDPVANHIGDRNSNSDAEVRDAIAPLNRLADELGCLLIGVRHPGKDRTRGAVASILGSTAWVDTPARGRDGRRRRRKTTTSATSRCRGQPQPQRSAQAFRIEASTSRARRAGDASPSSSASLTKSVDDLLVIRSAGNESRSAEARELILDILEEEGEQESDALDARVARESRHHREDGPQRAHASLKNEGLIKTFPEKDEHGRHHALDRHPHAGTETMIPVQRPSEPVGSGSDARARGNTR